MSDVLHQNLTELQEKAKANGWTVLTPLDNELFLDRDEPASYLARGDTDILGYLGRAGVTMVSCLTTVSPGGNTHIYIKLDTPLPELERILLQAVLGSDRRKECLTYIQHKEELEAPIAFFEVPGQLDRVIKWRSNFAK